jgi:hypothetical protein
MILFGFLCYNIYDGLIFRYFLASLTHSALVHQ